MNTKQVVSVTDLRFSLLRVLSRLFEHKEIIITKDGKPIAKLIEYQENN